MKRHPSLAPLSRQHHPALMLSQLLKKNAPAYKGLPTDTEGKMLYATQFYHSDLVPHFADEEKVFDKLKNISPLLDVAIKEIVEEHVLLHQMFKDIPGQMDAAAYLDVLGHKLEKHIRKEDRELFPMIEQLVDEATMSSINDLLNH